MSDQRGREHRVPTPTTQSFSRPVVQASSGQDGQGVEYEGFHEGSRDLSASRGRSSTAPSGASTSMSAGSSRGFAPLPHPQESYASSTLFAGQLPPGYRLEGPYPSVNRGSSVSGGPSGPRFDTFAYHRGVENPTASSKDQHETLAEAEGGVSLSGYVPYVPPHRQRESSGFQASRTPGPEGHSGYGGEQTSGLPLGYGEQGFGVPGPYGPMQGSQPTSYTQAGYQPPMYAAQAQGGPYRGGQKQSSFGYEQPSGHPGFDMPQSYESMQGQYQLPLRPHRTYGGPIQHAPTTPEYSIFVGQLGREVDEGSLWKAFGPRYQSFIKANLMRDRETGLSRGFAFVRFTNENDRDHALNTMSGAHIGNSPIVVGKANKEMTKGTEEQAERAISSTEGTMSMYGGSLYNPAHPMSPNPTGAPPMQSSHGGYPQPYSTFDSRPTTPYSPMVGQEPPSSVQHEYPMGYITGPRGYPGMPGDPMMQAVSEHVDPNNITVFVGGLAYGSTQEQLREIFKGAGEILHITIPAGKGCGFVKFATHRQAFHAMTSLQGTMLNGNRLRLSWGKHAR